MRSPGTDNEFLCDRCGASVGNAGINLCAIIADLDPDNPGMVVNRHLCRENGCCTRVLTVRALAAYNEIRAPSTEEK